jgi:hypothetical protein
MQLDAIFTIVNTKLCVTTTRDHDIMLALMKRKYDLQDINIGA